MIKAIIFDFDGTLSNRQLNAHEAYSYYLRDYFPGVEGIEFEAIVQDMLTNDMNGTTSIKYRVAAFVDKYNLPEDFEEKFRAWWYPNMYKFTVLKKDAMSVLKQLRQNYKLGILSNGGSTSQHSKINKFDLESYVDEIIISGDYDIHKPDIRLFEMMAEKLGVKCEECLFVGDVFSSDILGACRAKMTPVWILEDTERPSGLYDGYRIERLSQIFEVLDQEKK